MCNVIAWLRKTFPDVHRRDFEELERATDEVIADIRAKRDGEAVPLMGAMCRVDELHEAAFIGYYCGTTEGMMRFTELDGNVREIAAEYAAWRYTSCPPLRVSIPKMERWRNERR